MRCYNCGADLQNVSVCQNCGADVRLYKKIMMASNAYYNDGLEKARVRDLSGSIESLKMALRFNKRNIEARNLLGLVYYEIGEVVAALSEWVISKNYQPKQNLADRYLNEVQKNQARLQSANQTIKKYNQALLYCKQDNRDMAILQLKKVLSLNPKLVSGHQLLALLYIKDGKYDLAKKSLQNAGKIDVNNKLTLRYLQEANVGMKEQSSNKKPKVEELVSFQSGNEMIIQPKYVKETSAVGTIVNMMIGLAIGVAITWFLVVPGVRRNVMNEAKKEVLEANDTISSRNQTISLLEKQVDELTGQLQESRDEEEGLINQLSSYEQLLLAYEAYHVEDIETAGNALGNVNTDYLSSDAKNIYDSVNTQVNAEYLESLYIDGSKAYSARRFTEAAELLQKAVDLDETYDDGNALYYLAQSYRKLEETELAKTYYQKFIELYPGTERAANSQNYIDEME